MQKRNFDLIFQPRRKNDKNLLSGWQSIGKIKIRVLVTTTVLVSLLLVTQLVFAASLATDGRKLSEIGSEIQRLEAENTTLKAKIAQAASLATLSEKAQVLGFEKPTKVITP
ncbi:hypothetical protein A2697_01280 [Candidatus Curtissbacteria bacterium RIFCSPHIGHO2_01_FULL_41_44]|uniref:Cell division protein FtsL n=1 Tax=Candidatus Curtissbacteria bacterium RIFCSPLOWO2_01_FULL_42_50 TaxID=1797730 RepID=A0A1F5H3F5_9BACT|nr:MAG: hypothetical protein A2697_01280 [Candidatus Curtissbacteria bacterium RIFCSPHIGHO2_01_FULL_41_44]OGD98574.1 MAG: hypothetical protein A3B54_05325 [Candidatus Curtissbacteria bacterium RIFCSPLOWO2_01_FULL_42_50]OGE02150.1 MAG: hypothetical protein A3G16_02180 [Candidatus Curtissbacteria bacterium RIFCSPLOWO2_12_FULL_41_16]OGE11178.1 MAG: hypothetical protein A3H87_01400 [Candidatus Curtissbacteria bacterium RIFCSPLOWO2_02_FULL_42_37]